MYPGKHATTQASHPAVIMAGSGETVTYGELEARSNRLAHLLRAHGVKRLDHYSIFMENNARYVECCTAGERTGTYYTCVNSFLTADELAYILNNSASKVLITSQAKRDVALAALAHCPEIALCVVVDGPGGGSAGGAKIVNLAEATAGLPATPIADESLGTAMLYSSGTTGRPKGIVRPLAEQPPSQLLPIFSFLLKLWQYREGMIYLSPAPLYHSAPQAAVNLTIRMGGSVIIMERFDPEHYLQLIERYRVTHSQLVPTMFSRMLKLPEETRKQYELGSLEIAIHAAAPCPVQVKEQMIGWWGPIIHEYYGATEGLGFTACNSQEWLAHKGTVGRVLLGELHVLDDDMKPLPAGTAGTLWFKTATPFEYFNDPAKTREARSEDGTMSTVGDVGYVDADGYLYLTDRATFMIISGGVNIYPQECENLLITHPKVADAAVFGVPNADLGEEVEGGRPAHAGRAEDERHRRGADRLLRPSSRPAEGAALRRFRGRAAAPADRANSTSACCATVTGATRRAASCDSSARPALRPRQHRRGNQGGQRDHAHHDERVGKSHDLRLALHDRRQVVDRARLLLLVRQAALLQEMLELRQHPLGRAIAPVLGPRQRIGMEARANLEEGDHQVDAEGAAELAHEVGDARALAHLVGRQGLERGGIEAGIDEAQPQPRHHHHADQRPERRVDIGGRHPGEAGGEQDQPRR